MTKIELSVPRSDVERLVDIFHLNGFKTKVERAEDGPASLVVSVPDEQLVERDTPLRSLSGVC